MNTISINNIVLGMTLSNDVVTSRGRFLLSAGTVIEKKHLRILKMWGITEVYIQSADEASGGEKHFAQEALSSCPECECLYKKLFASVDIPGSGFFSELYRLGMEKCGIKKREFMKWQENLESLENDTGMDRGSAKEILSLSQLLDKQSELASLPDVYFRIIEILEDPSSSAVHLAEAISKDPSLAGRLLRLVNSSLYGGRGGGIGENNGIDSLVKAITLVGFEEMSSLGLGISVIRTFENIPSRFIDMKEFWIHSTAAGVVSRLLAYYVHNRAEERFFMGGLLHNVGRLILLSSYPGRMREILRTSVKNGLPVHQLEKKTFGYDNAEIGSALLERWKFPDSLRNMVRYQHDPIGEKPKGDVEIIHIALIICSALRYGLGGEYLVFPGKKGIWESLELSPAVLGPLEKQAERQISEIQHVFLGNNY